MVKCAGTPLRLLLKADCIKVRQTINQWKQLRNKQKKLRGKVNSNILHEKTGQKPCLFFNQRNPQANTFPYESRCWLIRTQYMYNKYIKCIFKYHAYRIMYYNIFIIPEVGDFITSVIFGYTLIRHYLVGSSLSVSYKG